MNQITQYPNTNFYSGIPGKPFVIKKQFASINELLYDMQQGWRSPIAISDYVIISEGLSDYEYQNQNIEKIEFDCSDSTITNNAQINFSGTLWQKISKIKTVGDSGKPFLDIEEPNNTYFVTDNNIGYQLIADLNSIPKFSLETKVLPPNELPQIKQGGSKTAIELSFGLPRSAQFHLLDTIIDVEGDYVPLIDSDGKVKTELIDIKSQQEHNINLQQYDYVLYRPAGILYQVGEIQNNCTTLTAKSIVNTQLPATNKLTDSFVKNDDNEFVLNQPSVFLKWMEYRDNEGGYHYTPSYTFELPKNPKIEFSIQGLNASYKEPSISSPFYKDNNTVAYGLNIPVVGLDNLVVEYYVTAKEDLPQNCNLGDLAIVVTELDDDSYSFVLYAYGREHYEDTLDWIRLGVLNNQVSQYGNVTTLGEGYNDNRSVYSAAYIDDRIGWTSWDAE